jgi:hypothetical protein
MGEARDSIADVWGERTPHLHNMWSVRKDERTPEGPDDEYPLQASKEQRDDELLAVCIYLDEQNKRQQAWLTTQIEHRAPHTLVVPQ